MHFEDHTAREIDPFRPPAIPTEVFCLMCQREYESYLIEWREAAAAGHGRWCCPTPGCHATGFGFEILPTDPEYVGEDGRPLGLSAANGELIDTLIEDGLNDPELKLLHDDTDGDFNDLQLFENEGWEETTDFTDDTDGEER